MKTTARLGGMVGRLRWYSLGGSALMRAMRAESLFSSTGRPFTLRPLQLRDRQMFVSGLFSLRQPRQTQVRGFMVMHPWHKIQ